MAGEGEGVFLEGQLPQAPRLAIVGSRAARRASLEAVEVLVAAAQAEGCAVVSGGAVGVDAAAHRAALARGVPQVAVLPLGSDQRYPPHHDELFERIVRSGRGALVHGQSPGTRPTRGMFASRNRIVVELSDAVVVVQAGLRSGTLGTGRLALRMGRPLGVLPGSPGAAQLAAQGGRWVGDGRLSLTPEMAQRWLNTALRGGSVPGDLDGVDLPAHLRDVVVRAKAAGATGITADDCDMPVIALGQLAEAEALGLLVAVGGGRYVSGAAGASS